MEQSRISVELVCTDIILAETKACAYIRNEKDCIHLFVGESKIVERNSYNIHRKIVCKQKSFMFD